MAWIRFVYDDHAPCMNFKPGDAVEVPDDVVRRWQIVWELFVLIGIEMGDFKARSWNPATKALPQRLDTPRDPALYEQPA